MNETTSLNCQWPGRMIWWLCAMGLLSLGCLLAVPPAPRPRQEFVAFAVR